MACLFQSILPRGTPLTFLMVLVRVCRQTCLLPLMPSLTNSAGSCLTLIAHIAAPPTIDANVAMTNNAKTEAMMAITAKRYSADVSRLMDDDKIVGFAIKLTNGKWCMTDTEDRRMDSIQYGSPNEVAKCFHTMRLLTTP
jgi:hypothetical protein